ncbi:transcriptional regulator [Nocardioides marmoriginsengisoli]|uniref:Transcriptional regulator n=1 Tax=Nocardioides marmoriginsengisoli TaxID=661483 RepID=A0A3N0CCD8_9ACTN|nr:helix-turn-helix domain-containing protein [Nocardioides marmoriginsengisoli]RNL61098.1 transcriptional regulator [Nocardioides marmoriginsengisoli]
MQRRILSDQQCSVARTLDIVGDRWTPLVLRDIALGISRFDAIQADLGVSRKVLTQRLDALVEHAVLVRVPYSEHPPRYDYRLTEKGDDLALVLLALQQFGDKWAYGGEPPIQWRHLSCGQLSAPVACCDKCGEPVRPGDAIPLRGPSFDETSAPAIAEALDEIAAAFG